LEARQPQTIRRQSALPRRIERRLADRLNRRIGQKLSFDKCNSNGSKVPNLASQVVQKQRLLSGIRRIGRNDLNEGVNQPFANRLP
jgi:hypothetical protein